MSFLEKLSAEKSLSLRSNGYDLLRLVLAAAVVYSHSHVIGGFDDEPLKKLSKEGAILGGLGVLGFFGLSGYLVSASFERSTSLLSYFVKRVRRIFPGFWVCLVFTAFAFAPAIWLLTGRPLADFPWFGADSAWRYVSGNFFLYIHYWTIASVLPANAYGSLNGSLWSLLPEFGCYVFVAVLGIGGAFSRSRWLVGAAALVAFTYHVIVCTTAQTSFPAAPSFFSLTIYSSYFTAFAVGACFCAWRDHIKFTWGTVAVLVFSSVLLLKLGGFNVAAPILVTALVLCVGGCFVLRLKTDLSYGVYIYSFPCQQLLFAAGVANAGFAVYCLASLVASAGCAWLSWKFVERPALNKG